METAETIAQPQTAPAAEVATEQPRVPEHMRGLRIVAALASAVVPGLGHWFLGARLQAVAFHVVALAIAACYRPGRLPASMVGLLFVTVAAWVVSSLSTWSALRTRASSEPVKPLIWLLVFIPIALAWSSVLSNRAMVLSGFQTYSIPSQSMEHTLDIGDRVIADALYYRNHVVKPGDLVIFMKDGKHVVKRVIASGGGEVQGENGAIFVSGERITEPYVVRLGTPVPELETFGPVAVPPRMLFVMGDNRNWSFDSRSPQFGLVPESAVVARPLYLYYSEQPSRNGRKVQ